MKPRPPPSPAGAGLPNAPGDGGAWPAPPNVNGVCPAFPSVGGVASPPKVGAGLGVAPPNMPPPPNGETLAGACWPNWKGMLPAAPVGVAPKGAGAGVIAPPMVGVEAPAPKPPKGAGEGEGAAAGAGVAAPNVGPEEAAAAPHAGAGEMAEPNAKPPGVPPSPLPKGAAEEGVARPVPAGADVSWPNAGVELEAPPKANGAGAADESVPAGGEVGKRA